MKMPKNKLLKCQFHCHVGGDPCDHIRYSPRELVDEAMKLRYDVLAITCHRAIVFDEEVRDYAASKGLLLVRGIEFEIDEQHILALNVDKDINEVETFYDLKKYRQNHPNTLVIAPHPYFPGKTCLGESLERHIDLFDAIEISWAGTKTIDFNKKARKIAKSFGKPLVATADCHFINDLDIGYCKLDCEQKWAAILKTVREGRKIKNHHKKTSIFKVLGFTLKMAWQNWRHK
jgi:predicted metal-dependent phosphoesterase TrpH